MEIVSFLSLKAAKVVWKYDLHFSPYLEFYLYPKCWLQKILCLFRLQFEASIKSTKQIQIEAIIDFGFQTFNPGLLSNTAISG